MKQSPDTAYTASDALTDALLKSGVTHVFLNSGTDYPPIIESWAKYEALGLKLPEIIISPHETAALSAAQGAAQMTGQPQAVFVHVDVGTQNLGGTIHNACRGRVPVFILAGLSPFTMENELKGGRNAAIQFIQNVSDQGSIVRPYTKLCQELRSGSNIQQMVYRSLQLACSEPAGPVYLMATREVLEEESVNVETDLKNWAPLSPAGLDDDSLDKLADALKTAKNPLIITSYLGRKEKSVAELVALSDRLAIPVIEVGQNYMNFPYDHPMHLGFESHTMIKDRDVILVIDCDMPWIPAAAQPGDGCRVFYLDIDPLKETIPLWYIPSERFMKADSYTALRQLNSRLASLDLSDCREVTETRRAAVTKLHTDMRAAWRAKEAMGVTMTSEYLTACLREVFDEDTVILNESISDRPVTNRHLPRNKPGTLFTSGGSSLGWHGGAAVGMKLAHPEKEIVALTGDGTYIFSCPTAVFWMARKYSAPFLTVIYNNQGWNAPKSITKGEHPGGYAERQNQFRASFEPAARLDLVAEAAGGAFARTVSEPSELKQVLLEAREAVRKGTSAVVNVLLPKV